MRLIDADVLCRDLLDRWGTADTRKEELIRAVMADVVTPIVACQPTIESPTGKWEEKEVIHADEAKEAIEEWQSCRCSECGRYDTRPYMYYFSEPRFCSYCGADMRGDTE